MDRNSESRQIKGFFSKKEVEALLALQETLPIFNDKAFVQEKEFRFEMAKDLRIKERVMDLIGPFDFYWSQLGHFLAPYQMHADNVQEGEQISHKILLFPLFIDPGHESHTIVFHQKMIGPPRTLLDSEDMKNEDFEVNRRTDDLKNVSGLHSEIKISRDHYFQYLDHISPVLLKHFSIQGIYPWEPGSAILFDRDQIHCSSNFTKNGEVDKRGLTLFTSIHREKERSI